MTVIDSNPFSATPYTPPDAMFELKAAYDRDESPIKITLGPGAYQDNNGRAWILPSVAGAEKAMAASHPGHEYLPILGLPAFRQAAREVIFGTKSSLLSSGRIASVQSTSGTGAIHIAAIYLRDFYSSSAKVYVSNPSWSNHRVMFEYVGFTVVDYPYWNAADKSVDVKGMLACMEEAEVGSIFILHPCAHNPTGCDLTHEQWEQVGAVIKRRGLIPILDSAYQGFASGDLDNDAWPIRRLLEGFELPGLVCQSFSKSMGLYGERVGALHVVLPPNSPETLVRNIESQIGWISRKEISVPGRYGATIAATVWSDPTLRDQWRADMKTMSGRITEMRRAVVDGLTARKTPGDWSHITRQIGMFSYTGISREHVLKLREKHIYMAENGRASISGLNTGNVDYFCQCVHDVLTA